jgi:hypothetical protein
MVENDLDLLEDEKPRKFTFKWLFALFFRPGKSLVEITEKNHAVWIAPLLVLMASALLVVLVSAPIIGQASQVTTPPQGFEYYSPEQQKQFAEAVAVGASPVVTLIFPLAIRFLGIWLGWFLLASILHLSLTLNGSRSSNRAMLNIVAWASLPFAVRDIVQAAAILINHQLINKPGLSGFVPTDAGGFTLFFGAFITFIDIYLIWQFALVVLGAGKVSGLKPGKVWLATILAFIIFLSLKALPGFVGAQLGSLSSGGMFF